MVEHHINRTADEKRKLIEAHLLLMTVQMDYGS